MLVIKPVKNKALNDSNNHNFKCHEAFPSPLILVRPILKAYTASNVTHSCKILLTLASDRPQFFLATSRSIPAVIPSTTATPGPTGWIITTRRRPIRERAGSFVRISTMSSFWDPLGIKKPFWTFEFFVLALF